MKIGFQDFRIGWRWMTKEASWTALVIGGLAIGFACCFLLMSFVRHSFSFDKHLDRREHVYLLKSRWNVPNMPEGWQAAAPLAAADSLRSGGQTDKVSIAQENEVSVRIGNVVKKQRLLLVEPDFLDLLEVKTLNGDTRRALSRPDQLVLTDRIANKFFGTSDVVGKTLTIDRALYVVAAIVASPPSTSTRYYEILAGRDNSSWGGDIKTSALSNWGNTSGNVYFSLRDGAAAPAAVAQLQRQASESPMIRQFARRMSGLLQGKPVLEFLPLRLADAYFDPDITASADPARHSSIGQLWGLSAVALLILLLAAVNYINLATVRTARRQVEIGICKVLGASVARVAGKFLAESLLTVSLAMLSGLLLAWLLLPGFCYLMGRELENVFDPVGLTTAAIATVLTGILAGAYPAWVAINVHVTKALAGRGQQETRQGIWLRRILTVLQFAVAMGLAGSALALAWQTWYASHINPGFEPSGIFLIETGKFGSTDELARQQFRQMVQTLPGVYNSGYSTNNIHDGIIRSLEMHRNGGDPATMEWRGIDCNYLQTYGITPIAGRLFASCRPGLDKKQPGWVLTESAVRQLGFSSPQAAIGQILPSPKNDSPMEIIGVIADLRLQNARETARPQVFMQEVDPHILSISFNGDAATLQQSIAQLWPRYFPDYPLKIETAAYRLNSRYEQDLKMALVLALASAVALLIAAFGIYVLSAYAVKRMTREVVLRKIFGARQQDIIRLLSREFLLVIATSALLGLPPALLFIRYYLADFVERAPIGAWTLFASLSCCTLVAALAVWKHMHSALRLPPAQALRS